MAPKKTSVDPRRSALEMLAPSIADNGAKVLFGTKAVPGFFSGSGAAAKTAADLCVAENWLEPTGEKTGKGRSEKALYRLTMNGRRAILDNNPATVLLENLQTTVKDQLDQLHKVSATLGKLEGGVRELDEVIREAVQKAKAPAPMTATASANGANGHVPPHEIEEEVVRRVQSVNVHSPRTLPELYKELSGRWPELSLGEFHDCIRRLWTKGRIRLGPYTGSFGGIARDYEAVFLDGEVMYYAYSAA